MRRRSFLTALTALTAGLPLAARSAGRLRTVAFLFSIPADHPLVIARSATMRQQLAARGWIEGENLRLRFQPTSQDDGAMAKVAENLVRDEPEIIVTGSSAEAAAVLAATRRIPVLFSTASDPVGSGFVRSLERPDNNATGFSNNEPSMAGKWLELLTEIAPATRRIGLVYNPATAAAGGKTYLERMRMVGADQGIEILDAPVSDSSRIEPVIAGLAAQPASGLMFPPDSFTFRYARICAGAAAQHRVPAMYLYDTFVSQGGLMSYTGGRDESGELIASYIDLILRGANVAELPVQFSRSFELVLNERAAAALGLSLPMSLRVRASRIVS